MREPDFWRHRGITARLLAPLGALHGAVVAFKAAHARPYQPQAPVICVGNLTAGGSGKTPVAIAVAQILKERGKQPLFLTRGYGGKERGPVLVRPHHQARAVGDESLLLARIATTIVARDRAIGAAMAAREKADVLVMDDGHQNFSLVKSLSLVVVDGGGFANGMILPAGPLRENVGQGLARADAVIIMGSEGRSPKDGRASKRALDIAALDSFAGPILYAHLQPEPNDLAGRAVFAFAGIGRPQKFFDTVIATGAILKGTHAFDDHYFYKPADLANLRAEAKGALLVTTEKDLVRLAPEQRQGIEALGVTARFDDPALLVALLQKAAP